MNNSLIKRSFCSFFCVFILSFIIANPAYAYLDPGAGSVILQGIIAGIVGLLVVLKLYWHRILVFLKIRKKIELPENKPEETKRTDPSRH